MNFHCSQGCTATGTKRTPPPRQCDLHKLPFIYENQLGNTPKAQKRRKPLKRGRGFAASPKQRGKVKGLPCAYCGKEGDEWTPIDPAHLWPRGKGGCDHIDCVIPLCRNFREDGRNSCHRLFDEGKLELLPSLIDRGYWAEMAHPIACHNVSPYTLVARLTCSADLGAAA